MAEASFGKRRSRPPKEINFDYKDVELLQNFVSQGGRIIAARVSRLSSKQQRALKRAVKRARSISLLPYGSF